MKRKMGYFLGVIWILCSTFFDNRSQCFAADQLVKVSKEIYDLNGEAYGSEGWYKEKNGAKISDDQNSLHVFAFNVGQGNCIILRKGKDVVIVDAGRKTGGGEVKKDVWKKIQTVLGNENDPITLKAIFITHGDQDHISFISKLVDNQHNKVDGESRVYLGGSEVWWGKKDKLIKTLGNKFDKKIEYITTQSIGDKKIMGVTFNLIAPGRKAPNDKANPQSLIIEVLYKGQSVLFTGDAEGEGFVRRTGSVDNVEHGNLLSAYLQQDEKGKNIKLDDGISEDKNKDIFLVNRKVFQSLGVVFLPHHGTATEESQRWIRSLSGSSRSVTWFVSSSPNGKDRIPESSIFEECPPLPKQNLHIVSYALPEANLDKKKWKVGNRFTEKPLYITGSAPGGVYWLRISGNDNNGKTEFYDAYPKVDKGKLKQGITTQSLLSAIDRIKVANDNLPDRGWQDISPKPLINVKDQKNVSMSDDKKGGEKGEQIDNSETKKSDNFLSSGLSQESGNILPGFDKNSYAKNSVTKEKVIKKRKVHDDVN